MVLAGPGCVWHGAEGLSGEAGDWSSVDGQMLIKSTIDKLLQLILAQLSIIFTVIKNWIDRVNEEFFKSDNSLSGQGGVWHGAEGICGDAGESSSDGHASHPVSVDHSWVLMVTCWSKAARVQMLQLILSAFTSINCFSNQMVNWKSEEVIKSDIFYPRCTYCTT